MTTRPADPLLSVVVPCFNEEANLRHLAERLDAALAPAGIRYELILVDDGSRDATLAIMRELNAADRRVRWASFSRNFGHEAATTCGFALARGDMAVLMDADLQDPPELIPQMVARWREGCDVVAARRRERHGESAWKRATSKLFYRLMNRLSDVDIPLDVGDFRLVDRKAIDAFNRFTERNRFVRGLFAWVGFRQGFIEYDRPARHGGETKYSTRKLLLLSLDALFSYSLVPLRLITLFGLFVTSASVAIISVVVVQKLLGLLHVEGYALMTTGLFFLGGSILVFLGVIGEYVGKIYQEAQGRPLYLLRECSDPGESAPRA